MSISRPTSPVSLRSQAVDDLFISTLDSRRAEIVDVVFHKNPFFYWLSANGRVNGQEGGAEIVIDLEVGENDSVKSFAKGETFTEEAPEIFTQAFYAWKQMGGSITRYGVDDAKNAGKSQIINMVNKRIDNLIKTMKKRLEAMIISDGTGNNGQDIDGIQLLINAAGTGTVGRLNAATYAWWRNKVAAATGAASVYLTDDLRGLWQDIGGDDEEYPDFHITTPTVWGLYEDECWEAARLVNQTMGSAGFEHLVYRGAPVIAMSRVPDGYWYMMNTMYIEFIYNTLMNFKRTGWKEKVNGIDKMMQIVLMANMVTSNRSKVGVLTGVAA